jgi:hypothetical protein
MACWRRERVARRWRTAAGTWTIGAARGVLLCLIFLLPGVEPSPAQSRKPTESDVKAAYLFNFGKFVKWPAPAANRDSAFTICVLGHDPFGTTLDATVSGEKVDGKAVVVRRVTSQKEASGCRIVFISSSEDSKVKLVLAGLDPGVLTVSDMPHFAEEGGMIQFVTEGNRVRFTVNLTAAEKAGLTLSSELLKVATNVRKDS